MFLKGSCHCHQIQFSVESEFPCPYKRCYCRTCLKIVGGPAVTLVADANTLVIQGKNALKIYQAPNQDPLCKDSLSQLNRFFCKYCGSQLWTIHQQWPDIVYLYASAIDSELIIPPETTHFMTHFRVLWQPFQPEQNDRVNSYFPKESHQEWKQRIKSNYSYDV